MAKGHLYDLPTGINNGDRIDSWCPDLSLDNPLFAGVLSEMPRADSNTQNNGYQALT